MLALIREPRGILQVWETVYCFHIFVTGWIHQAHPSTSNKSLECRKGTCKTLPISVDTIWIHCITSTYVTPSKLLLAILSNLYLYLLPQADRASAAGLLPPKRTHRRCRRPALCLAPQGGGDCAGASTADLSTSMPLGELVSGYGKPTSMQYAYVVLNNVLR